MKSSLVVYITATILLSISNLMYPQSVVNSKHNLSVTGPGSIRATSESEICIFCHTPHSTSPQSPLWNRNDPGSFYLLYSSSTIQASPGQPDGSSILCLSCHDGTIALGSVLNRTSEISFAGGITILPSGKSNLTTDLADDHPVSFIYNSALAASDGQLKDPASISHPVTLENGKMQCTSCHDAHNNMWGKFLAASNQFSELCFKCHDRNYWGSSSHNNSSAQWDGTGIDPWQHTEWTTVAENGCENCHNPHTAGGKPRLMNFLAEESNCLSCHNGHVASTNISAQLTKPYIHNVYGYGLDHDPTEDALVNSMHVECEDCHNPHAVNNSTATAPVISGYLAGTKGINQSGSPVDPAIYQYEVCYRCHADSPGKPSSRTARQIEQNNVMLEFDLSNPSFHPIEGAGTNSNSPSLISPGYTESSVIYCTDCHASDGASSPAGPHGSIYPSILRMRYLTADNTNESPSAYELCYSCHDRASILGDNSFEDHRKHIVEENTPCNACHDPHGISSSQGTSTNNTHLINFDTDIVSPDNSIGARFRFEDLGEFRGRCYLRCHGQNHPGWSYGL